MRLPSRNLNFKFHNRLKLLRSYINRNPISYGFPISISIELTSRCNLACTMCSRTFNLPLEERDIDFEVFKKVINEGKEKGVEALLLYGCGEPLLHPKIVEMVKYCNFLGLKTHLATNATLLTEEISKNLIEAGLSFVIFGIDGATKDVYEKYRLGARYEQVVKNIKTFLGIKRRFNSGVFVEIQMIKMRENFKQIALFEKQWKIKGVNSIRIKEDEVKREDLALGNSEETKRSGLCVFPWLGPLPIGANGDIIYHDWSQRPMTLNVMRNSLEEIWNSDEMQLLRIAHLKGNFKDYPECAHCKSTRPLFPFSIGSFIINNHALRKYLHIVEYAARFLKMPIFSSKI